MSKSYVMVGSGGTGTHLLGALIAFLSTRKDKTWRLNVIDGDAVEVKNLSRQLFHPAMVTMNKAEAAILPYQHLSKNVVAIPEYLGKDNIAKIIMEGSIVLICVDNFPVRALIESYCNTLQDITVINGGNDVATGSCQIWQRVGGKNVTPHLSYNHPEVLAPGKNRSEMTCEETAKLPGGEQLIVTNMTSAMLILLGLMNVENKEITWTETQFDLTDPRMALAMDYRDLGGWQS